jgi:hypothetical protein
MFLVRSRDCCLSNRRAKEYANGEPKKVPGHLREVCKVAEKRKEAGDVLQKFEKIPKATKGDELTHLNCTPHHDNAQADMLAETAQLVKTMVPSGSAAAETGSLLP